MDFKDIKGLHTAKRGLEVAAAGCLPVFIVGAMGAGKTMMADAMSTITDSAVRVRDGINLEQYNRRLKFLKEARDDMSGTQWVFTGLPCRCGNFFNNRAACICDRKSVTAVLTAGIGIKDYVPVQFTVQSADKEDIAYKGLLESSADVRERVLAAKEILKNAYGCEGKYIPYEKLEPELDDPATALLKNAYERMHMSMGDRVNVLRTAAAIAALLGKKSINAACVAEAVQWSGGRLWRV